MSADKPHFPPEEWDKVREAQIEPSAAMRAMAAEARQIYVALKLEGFTPDEAIAIIGEIIRSNKAGS